MPHLYCIVVAYNSSAELSLCLENVLRIPDSTTVVVDNASTDDSVARAELHGVRVIVSLTNLGFGKAVNLALLERPHGADVLLINPDCEVSPESVQLMRQRFFDVPRLGITSPIMQYRDGTYGISGGSRPSMLKEVIAITGIDNYLPRSTIRVALRPFRRVLPVGFSQYLGSRPSDGLIPTQWVSGFCMMLRGATVEDVGGFDGTFFMYFEDVELCERAASHGWLIAIDAGAIATHDESSSSLREGKPRLYYEGLLKYAELRRGAVSRHVAERLARHTR